METTGLDLLRTLFKITFYPGPVLPVPLCRFHPRPTTQGKKTNIRKSASPAGKQDVKKVQLGCIQQKSPATGLAGHDQQLQFDFIYRQVSIKVTNNCKPHSVPPLAPPTKSKQPKRSLQSSPDLIHYTKAATPSPSIPSRYLARLHLGCPSILRLRICNGLADI
jgi:hypothetical protein